MSINNKNLESESLDNIPQSINILFQSPDVSISHKTLAPLVFIICKSTNDYKWLVALHTFDFIEKIF